MPGLFRLLVNSHVGNLADWSDRYIAEMGEPITVRQVTTTTDDYGNEIPGGYVVFETRAIFEWASWRTLLQFLDLSAETELPLFATVKRVDDIAEGDQIKVTITHVTTVAEELYFVVSDVQVIADGSAYGKRLKLVPRRGSGVF